MYNKVKIWQELRCYFDCNITGVTYTETKQKFVCCQSRFNSFDIMLSHLKCILKSYVHVYVWLWLTQTRQGILPLDILQSKFVFVWEWFAKPFRFGVHIWAGLFFHGRNGDVGHSCCQKVSHRVTEWICCISGNAQEMRCKQLLK